MSDPITNLDFVAYEEHVKRTLAESMLDEAEIKIGTKCHLHFVTQDVVLAQQVGRLFVAKWHAARINIEFRPTAVGQYVIVTGTGLRYAG